MALQIKKAVRQRKKLRIAVDGPSGAGKTYTLLRLAHEMVRRGAMKKIVVIDTERDSASLYAGVSPDGYPWEFDTIALDGYAPTEYTAAIHLAEKHGYDGILIDSLSHAWEGEGGALDLVDQKSTGNNWAAWKDVTPLHRRMVDAILQSTAHVLVTMRTKTEWTTEKDHRGKTVPVRVGTKSVQRDGMEYEFDVWGRMDREHQIHIEKTRCGAMDGGSAIKPGGAFWTPLLDWMEGAAVVTPVATVATDPRTQQERERDDFLTRLAGAARAELSAIGTAIKAKGFPPAVADVLRQAYGARLADLDAAEKAAAIQAVDHAVGEALVGVAAGVADIAAAAALTQPGREPGDESDDPDAQ
jgi:hypothetical protein